MKEMYYFSKTKLLKVTENFHGRGGNQEAISTLSKTNSDGDKT